MFASPAFAVASVPVNPDTRPASDAELARRIIAGTVRGRAGDAETELCRRFLPRLRQYGLRHLRNPAAAEDLAQHCLELTLTKLRAGEVQKPESIAAFVLSLARLQTRAMQRKQSRETDDGPLFELASVQQDESRPLAMTRLASCLEALSMRERSVVVATFYDEQSAAEIAQTLATSPGNVRIIRHRAVAQLKQCISQGESA